MMPDPDDILDSASEEWIDKVSHGIRDEIIEYFEGRFTTIEEALLAHRRFNVHRAFVQYLNERREDLASYRYSIESNANQSDSAKQTVAEQVRNCSRFMDEHIIVVSVEIRRQRNPEA